MSKSYFLRCKSLHALPKFVSNTQRIQVSNGQYVCMLFVIPVILTLQKHRFEVFTLVSEIHENVDLVLGIKNILVRRSGRLMGFLSYHFEQVRILFP